MLRPMGIGELLDAAFGVFRRRFATLALCVLVVVAPLTVLATLVQASATDGAFDLSTEAAAVEGGAGTAGVIVSNLLSLFAVVLATGACFRAVHGDVVGEDVSWQTSLRFAFGRAAPLLLGMLLYVLAVVVGLILLILPGIYAGVAFSLVAPAVLFERRGPAAALGRSFNLVKGHWWRIFGALVVMVLVIFVIQFLLGLVLGAVLVAGSSNEGVNAVVVTLITIAGYVITTPLQAALITFIYFDLRVRKEGFDLEMASRGIGDAPEPSPFGRPEEPSWPPAAPEQPGGGFLPPQPPSQR